MTDYTYYIRYSKTGTLKGVVKSNIMESDVKIQSNLNLSDIFVQMGFHDEIAMSGGVMAGLRVKLNKLFTSTNVAQCVLGRSISRMTFC